MRITKKLAESVISDVIGDDAMPAIQNMYKKSDISELDLADLYGGDINHARNVLYRMHNNNLVTFTKRKDKIKGWYVYYWTLNTKRIKELAIRVNEDRIEMLKNRLQREKGHIYYTCCNSCVRLDFDKATDFCFKCPECNTILVEEDNTEKINVLEKEMERLEKITA
ncbi:MAG: hypothetical protein ACQESG_01415 [Nanobdellota archaeon]